MRNVRSRRSGRRKVKKAKVIKATSSNLNTTKLRNNQILPSSLTVRNRWFMQGYIPAGAYSSGYFDVYLNRAFDALNPTTFSPFTSATNNTGVLINSGVITQNTLYYNKLVGSTGIYDKTRVLSSKITVSCNPQALADTMYIYIVPFRGDSDAPQLTSAFPYYPNSKQKLVCSNYASQRANTLSHSISVAKLCGVKRSTVMSETDFTAGEDGTPTIDCLWRVFYSSASATNFSNKFVFRVNLQCNTRYEGLRTDFEV